MFADPTKILELMYAYKTSEALFAANELDVFTLLNKKSLKGEEIAIRLKTVPEATIVLLDFLVTIGLLDREDGRYSNTPIAERFLMRGSSGYLGDLIKFERHLDTKITATNLLKGIKGKVEELQAGIEPELSEIYMKAMDSIAEFPAMFLARLAKLEGKKKLLDLGGGPGTFAITFYKVNPIIKATVFDFPEIVEIAKKNIARHQMEQNINVIGGDFTKDDIGKDYDCVILSNVMHFFNPEENKNTAKKCYEALNKGGIFILHDFFLEDDQKTKPFVVSELTIDWLTMGITFNFSKKEIIEVFKKIGFKEIIFKRLPYLPTSAVIGKK